MLYKHFLKAQSKAENVLFFLLLNDDQRPRCSKKKKVYFKFFSVFSSSFYNGMKRFQYCVLNSSVYVCVLSLYVRSYDSCIITM